MAVTIIAALLILLSPSVSSQWVRGAEMLCSYIASDHMYRFRVAVTPKSNLAYGIYGPGSKLAQYKIRVRGITEPVWESAYIHDLATKQPVINVDSTTDRIYFIHPVDGKVYCYDASLGRNVTSPVWVSRIVCAPPDNGLDQHLQTFTANGQRLLVRCNSSIVMLGDRGELLKTFASPSVEAFVRQSDLAAPLAVYANFTRLVTWFNIDSSNSQLEVWPLDARSSAPTKPIATFPLPPGTLPAGVTTGPMTYTLVADSTAPVLHILNSYTGKVLSSYDFKPVVDSANEMQISLLPTPVIFKKIAYGIVQGMIPSPYPWLVNQYPPKYFWWMFALSYAADPAAPVMKWLTPRQNTTGNLSPQVPWVTDRAVYVTDWQQNATRSFDLSTGQNFFNFPANPYAGKAAHGAYLPLPGTYKISLPWVASDGLYMVFQYDDYQYDALSPGTQASSNKSMGAIRAITGQPYSPPPPPQSIPPSAPE